MKQRRFGSIFGGIKWKPVNKTAAHGMSGSIVERVPSVDNPQPELARLISGLRPHGLTPNSPLYLFYTRVRASRAKLPRFVVGNASIKYPESDPKYQIYVKRKKSDAPFGEWAREFGYLPLDSKGDKKTVVAAAERLKAVFNGLHVDKKFIPKKSSTWKQEGRLLRILEGSE